MALSKEQIFQAAEQLVAAKETPTLTNVRKLLGGGSFSTISEAMAEWRTQQTASAKHHIALPQPLSNRFQTLSHELWSNALDLANKQLRQEYEALKAARSQMETAQQEAATLADQLSHGLETLQIHYQRTVEELQQTNNQLEQLRQENVILLQQIATANAQARTMQTWVDSLQVQLSQSQTTITHQQQTIDYLKNKNN